MRSRFRPVHSTYDDVMAQVKLKSTDNRKSATFYAQKGLSVLIEHVRTLAHHCSPGSD